MKAAPRQRAKAFVLPPALDIGNAQELHDTFVAAIEQSPVLRLNGSKVQQASTPGVQVLLSAAQSASAGGGRLHLSNPSPALLEAFSSLGLSSVLSEWRAANG
jgi:anti-anti-sigma factor